MIGGMGRNRSRRNADLVQYPGLHRDAKNYFYIKSPITGKRAYLGTKDKAMAIRLWRPIARKWDETIEADEVNRIAGRLNAANDVLSFSEYCKKYRETRLVKATKRNGEALGAKTANDYRLMLKNQIEPHKGFGVSIKQLDTKTVRQYLAAYMDRPATYNYHLSIISRVCNEALDEGLIDTSPATDIQRRARVKRKTYIDDETYLAITGELTEWEAKVCDLIYMVGGRPGDVLRLKHTDISDGIIHYTAAKNTQSLEIEMNRDLAALVAWFYSWKRKQGVLSRHVVCYPRTARQDMRGEPLSVVYMSRKFTAACRKLGYVQRDKSGHPIDSNGDKVDVNSAKTLYELRDLRPKGLTDEFLAGGENNKGGHKTEAMKQHYRRVSVPIKAASNVKALVK